MQQNPRRRQTPHWLVVARLLFVGTLLLFIVFGNQACKLYTDWLWFGELKQPQVFHKIVTTSIVLFVGFGLLTFIVCQFNFWLAFKLTGDSPLPVHLPEEREQLLRFVQRYGVKLAMAVSVLIAFTQAGSAAAHWADYLTFTHAGSFGAADPVFNLDIGFYVFKLPFMSFLLSWATLTLAISLLGAAAIHFGAGAMEGIAGGLGSIPMHARRHLLVILAILLTVFAGLYRLGRYDLLTADNAAFIGPGFTDLNVRLPVVNLQAVTMLLTALLCLVNTRVGKPFRLPLVGAALWLAVTIAGAGIVPGMVQSLKVVPNQFAAEKQFIGRNLAATRAAYGLGPDRVTVTDFPAPAEIQASTLQQEANTVHNIRLWDWPQLGQVYTATQALRTYYKFNLPDTGMRGPGDYNIDVDRYSIGGRIRQVMVAPRELSANDLPEQARTWQNQRLQYTHGYGLVMSPVDEVSQDGQPGYLLSGLPVVSAAPDLTVSQPQIYYGELASQYVYVDTKQKEFDYTSASGNQETRYSGTGGIPLTGLARLAFAARLPDANLLLSGDISSDSRILFRRNVRERVQALAPFLNLDSDPYCVLAAGKIYWVLDCYTVTDKYPYARPTRTGTPAAGVDQEFNYIRNSVKAVVDAYNGSVTLYVSDTTDPILRTWGSIFPDLLTPMSAMPAELRTHIRYPEDLFRIQRDVYSLYHITDERVYYGKEDAWEIPADPNPDSASAGSDYTATMAPYYIRMRLPDQRREEFVLMTPFTPISKQNLSAWMCARCDPEHYGQLVVYKFPRGSNVNGPQQVMSQVNSNQDISQYKTLLGQQGSTVIFGNLLIIPLGNTLLYAMPVYVQANTPGASVIPQINQVILATADRTVMQQTLEGAIAALGAGGRQQAATAITARSAPGVRRTPLAAGAAVGPVSKADAAYREAVQRETQYRKSLDNLGSALRDLEKLVPAPPVKR